jgi:hypothetical protein
MTLIHTLDLAADTGPPDDLNEAKAVVMAEFARIAEEGRAVLVTLESGAVELCLATGEIFHLGEEAITRVA